MKRAAAVAGSFYPGSEKTLRHTVEGLLATGAKASRAVGVAAPHAGYMYSGRVAGEVFSRVEVPGTVVILNPNHTGAGRPFAVWSEGEWETPLGTVKVDEELAGKLIETCPPLTADTRGHVHEHSGEVMLPFLQVKRPDVRVVVVVADMTRLDALQVLGCGIAEVLKTREERPLIVASTDMTHFESEEAARRRDKPAIEAMVQLDEEMLYEVVVGGGISMCGIAPVTMAISAAKALGATRGELVKYDTSATTSGDRGRVVWYAGVVWK